MHIRFHSRLDTREDLFFLKSNGKGTKANVMSTDSISAKGNADPPPAAGASAEQQLSQPVVPKKIVNAQTVCNEKNEKGKLCNGHLKQLRTGGEEAEVHLRGDEVLFKCQTCGTFYMGPPLGHVRDPRKQQRFVQKELTALLQAAGGSLPAFEKSATGAWVPVAEPAGHAPVKSLDAAKQTPATTPAAKPQPPSVRTPEPEDETPEQKRARKIAEANALKATAVPIPGASGPVEGETPEQKIARLKAVVAEAKRRKEAAGGGDAGAPSAASPSAMVQPTAGTTTSARTKPTAASTSGTDSSAAADEYRAAAEAQADTGQASAAPMSPATATAVVPPATGATTPASPSPAAPMESTSGVPKSATAHKGIPPPPPHLAPPPGETFEEKKARLARVVAEAKARAGK